MTLVPMPETSPDLAAMTLEELGAAAANESNLADAAFDSVLQHIRQAGVYLDVARARLGPAAWTTWVEQTFPRSLTTAQYYVRIARYWRDVENSGATTFKAAAAAVKGLPPANGRDYRARLVAEKAEVRQLLSQGVPRREIARIVGVSDTLVRYVADPAAYKRDQERTRQRVLEQRKAKRAAKREAALLAKEQERTDRLRTHGGKPSDAYDLLRRAAERITGAMEDASSDDERRHLRSANTHIQAAIEDIDQADKARYGAL